MAKFASRTQVSSEKSKQEIERILIRYGATEFGYLTRPNQAVIAFAMAGRNIRFTLPLPDRGSPEFSEYERGSSTWIRTPEARDKLYEQAIRQKWRALALVIKAKLEAVESGITDFEDEFLAYISLPGGQTMGQLAKPQIAHAYETGEMPPLLGHDND